MDGRAGARVELSEHPGRYLRRHSLSRACKNTVQTCTKLKVSTSVSFAPEAFHSTLPNPGPADGELQRQMPSKILLIPHFLMYTLKNNHVHPFISQILIQGLPCARPCCSRREHSQGRQAMAILNSSRFGWISLLADTGQWFFPASPVSLWWMPRTKKHNARGGDLGTRIWLSLSLFYLQDFLPGLCFKILVLKKRRIRTCKLLITSASRWKVTGRLKDASRLDLGECCSNKCQWNEGARAAQTHVTTGNKADNGEIAAPASIRVPWSAPHFPGSSVPSGPRLRSNAFRARPIKLHSRMLWAGALPRRVLLSLSLLLIMSLSAIFPVIVWCLVSSKSLRWDMQSADSGRFASPSHRPFLVVGPLATPYPLVCRDAEGKRNPSVHLVLEPVFRKKFETINWNLILCEL